jgi:hypothetical protein
MFFFFHPLVWLTLYSYLTLLMIGKFEGFNKKRGLAEKKKGRARCCYGFEARKSGGTRPETQQTEGAKLAAALRRAALAALFLALLLLRGVLGILRESVGGGAEDERHAQHQAHDLSHCNKFSLWCVDDFTPSFSFNDARET